MLSASSRRVTITYALQRSVPNPAVDLAPFGRWTLRDKAAQRRLALRWASPTFPRYNFHRLPLEINHEFQHRVRGRNGWPLAC